MAPVSNHPTVRAISYSVWRKARRKHTTLFDFSNYIRDPELNDLLTDHKQFVTLCPNLRQFEEMLMTYKSLNIDLDDDNLMRSSVIILTTSSQSASFVTCAFYTY